MQKLAPMFNVFVGIFQRGRLYDFEKPKHTQTRRNATTR